MIRPSYPEDAEAVRHLVHNANSHHTSRGGQATLPTLDDYGQRIATGDALV